MEEEVSGLNAPHADGLRTVVVHVRKQGAAYILSCVRRGCILSWVRPRLDQDSCKGVLSYRGGCIGAAKLLL